MTALIHTIMEFYHCYAGIDKTAGITNNELPVLRTSPLTPLRKQRGKSILLKCSVLMYPSPLRLYTFTSMLANRSKVPADSWSFGIYFDVSQPK